MEEKVSIVLPVYNGAERVSNSIESVLGQSYKNIELIIVNDCSTDDTSSVVRKYSDIDNRIVLIENKTNQKLPKSLNIGFRIATGEYLTWTSDDNVYHSNAIEKMVKHMEKDVSIGMVYADFRRVKLSGEIISTCFLPEPDEMKYENTVGACFLYRKSLQQIIGEYDPELFLAEDYEYWLRAYINSKIYHINECLYDYGCHDRSLSSTRVLEIHHKTFEAKNKHFNELYKLCLTRSEKKRFLQVMTSHLDNRREKRKVLKEYYKLNSEFKDEFRSVYTKETIKYYFFLPINTLRLLGSFEKKITRFTKK